MISNLRKPIAGHSVQLVPYSTVEHSAELYRITHGPEADSLFRYLPTGPFSSYEDFKAAVQSRDLSMDPQFFTLLSPSGQVVGTFALQRIEPAHRVIEVGNVLYSPLIQRSLAATEALYLLARYVFEDLEFRRFEWKCHNLNEPSKRAALRYGFTYEGLFRQHMIAKGANRDTAWYSMIDGEWPRIKAAFEKWLDPANFDSEGKQIQRLEDIRQSL